MERYVKIEVRKKKKRKWEITINAASVDFDLDGKRASFDAQATEIGNNKEISVKARKVLAKQTQGNIIFPHKIVREH